MRSSEVRKSDFIFGNIADFIYFLSPALFCIAFAIASVALSRESFQRLEGLAIVVAIVFLDRAHTFATFYRLLFSSEDRRAHGKHAAFLTLFCAVLFTWLHLQSSQLFWRVATYLTIWHVLRQHIGFAIYAEDKVRVISGFWERLFATAHLYLLWAGTFLGLHARPSHTLGWYLSEDLFKVPEIFRTFGIVLSLAGVWAYVLWTIYRYLKFKNLSKPSLLVWISSLFASTLLWLVEPEQNRILIVLSLSLLHSIPYLAASAKAFSTKDNLVSNAPHKFFQILSPGRMLLLATLCIGSAWQMSAMASLDALRQSYAAHGNKTSEQLFVSMLETFCMLPVFVHNLIDGRMWKRSRNPSSLRGFIVGAQGK